LIRIASANRLAAANPLAPRHRHGHFDSSFLILHLSYVSPTYSEKVNPLTCGTNVAFAQLRKFDARNDHNNREHMAPLMYETINPFTEELIEWFGEHKNAMRTWIRDVK